MASESASAPDSEPSLEEKLGLLPRTIVLAKVKGYRAWPAMVLAEDILPENIKNMKPKLTKQPKRGNPIVAVPVRFFSDDTYIWIRNPDLKILSKDEITSFLDKKATQKRPDALVFAYELALNPPDMNEFNRWGSAGPPLISEEDANEEEEEETPRKKLKLKINLKKPSKTSKSAKSLQRHEPSEVDGNEQSHDAIEVEDEQEEEQEEDEFGPDWGLQDEPWSFSSGNYIFDNENDQQNFVKEFPSAGDLANSLHVYQDEMTQIYKKIGVALMEGSGKEKELVKELKTVEKLLSNADMPLVSFTKSSLYRVLLLASHKPEENGPSAGVRECINRILQVIDVAPCRLSTADLVIATQSETPRDSRDQTPEDIKTDKEFTVNEPENKSTEKEDAEQNSKEGEAGVTQGECGVKTEDTGKDGENYGEKDGEIMTDLQNHSTE